MKRILSKKGFTLTETLIGTVVLLILAGAASTIILSCFGIYGRTTKRNSAQSIGDTIYELISERLTYSVDLTVTNDTVLIGETYNIVSDGDSCIFIPTEGDFAGFGVGTLAPPDVITMKQLEGMRLCVSIENKGDDLVGLTVTIRTSDAGRQLYKRCGTIYLMNAALGSVCNVFDCDNSSEGLFFVFKEPA